MGFAPKGSMIDAVHDVLIAVANRPPARPGGEVAVVVRVRPSEPPSPSRIDVVDMRSEAEWETTLELPRAGSSTTSPSTKPTSATERELRHDAPQSNRRQVHALTPAQRDAEPIAAPMPATTQRLGLSPSAPGAMPIDSTAAAWSSTSRMQRAVAMQRAPRAYAQVAGHSRPQSSLHIEI